MSKLIRLAAAAAIASMSVTAALAQATNQGQTNTQAAPKDDQTNPSGSSSRAMTGNEPSTDKAIKKGGQPDVKKLDSQGRGGQQN